MMTGGRHPVWCGLGRILPLKRSAVLDGLAGLGPDNGSHLLEGNSMALMAREEIFRPPRLLVSLISSAGPCLLVGLSPPPLLGQIANRLPHLFSLLHRIFVLKPGLDYRFALVVDSFTPLASTATHAHLGPTRNTQAFVQ